MDCLRTPDERFSHVVLANGGLPTGPVPAEFAAPLREAYKTLPVVKASELDQRFRDTSGVPGFLYWRKFCAESPEVADLGVFFHTIAPAGHFPQQDQPEQCVQAIFDITDRVNTGMGSHASIV
jgi:hypothetical protein